MSGITPPKSALVHRLEIVFVSVLLLALNFGAAQAEEMNAGDLAGAVRAAHALKSSSANVGAQRLAAICQSMERHGRSGDISAIVRNINPAWTEYNAAVDELVANKTEVAA